MSDEPSSFLTRWSQRKKAARAGEPLPDPEAPADLAPVASDAASSDSSSEPPLELPPLDSLRGIDSDYQAFMQTRVDEDTKRAALKQLFNDPHFNRMDGLDIYIDDYGKPDPIPAAMLAALNQARGLLYPIEEVDTSQTREEETQLASAEQNPLPAESDKTESPTTEINRSTLSLD